MMTSQESILTVQLTHQQLSMLRALIIQYRHVWGSKGKLPTHIADLLDSTDYQLVNSCSLKDSQ
jgi:hypothetical protein